MVCTCMQLKPVLYFCRPPRRQTGWHHPGSVCLILEESAAVGGGAGGGGGGFVKDGVRTIIMLAAHAQHRTRASPETELAERSFG